MEEAAHPVPPELDDIFDTMDYWGVRVSGLWKHKVIHVLVKKYLKGGQIPNRKSTCISLIAMLLHELLGVAVNSREFDDMMFNYCLYYRSVCRKNTHFFQLVVKCKRWYEANYVTSVPNTIEGAANVVTPERSSSTRSVSTVGEH